MRIVSFAITSIALAAVLTPLTSAQWNWQSPVPQGNTLLHAWFNDSTHGWAVGEYGTVLRTTTGGATWYEQEYGRTDNMLSVVMVSDTEGWAVGDNGVILHTIDAGDDWLEQSSGVTIGLNAVVFLDNLNGWVSGDDETILHTSDGGANWTIQHQAGPTISLNDITFSDPAHGWTVGSNQRIYRTRDGGATWLSAGTIPGLNTYLSVNFLDTLTGIVVGSHGSIVRTTDGGTSWIPASAGDTTSYNQVIMENSLVGLIVGDGGRFIRTINGGASWGGTTIADGRDLNGIVFTQGKILSVGELGTIVRSTNGGNSWSSLDAGSRLSANWIDFPSGSVGVSVGQTGLIMRSTDGGSTWSEQTSPIPSVSCYGVKFTDETHGWAVGDNGTILRTTDGSSWSPQTSPTTNTLFGIGFPDAANGWIVGGDLVASTGQILHSTDGGGTWGIQKSGIADILFGTAFVSSTHGWAVGAGGTILATTDGGSTWNPQTSGVTGALYWCSFGSATTGWAVGDNGTILHTTDGGASWSPQHSGVNDALFSIANIGTQEAFIAGDMGTILHTTDGGATWIYEYSRTPNGLFGIAVTASSQVFACGDYGAIIKNAATLVPGSISGMVFNDLNGNGVQDGGEPGMSGWEIILNGPVADTILSASGGTFSVPDLPLGSYTLREEPRSAWAQTVPASPAGYSFSLTVSSTTFSGDFGNHTAAAAPFAVIDGWNMLSLPLQTSDSRTDELYPAATSRPYVFTGGYAELDTVPSGLGFWLKFPAVETVWVAGSPIHRDTIGLAKGWNLIGSIIDTVATSALATIPSGIIASNCFGYNGAYTPTASIVPGYGYWLKSSGVGLLIYSGARGTAAAASIPADRLLQDTSIINTIRIGDRKGSATTLYFGEVQRGGIDSDRYELPPLPPEGCFDARFANGTELHTFEGPSAEPGRILVQATEYPLRISWRVNAAAARYQLRDDKTGAVLIESMSGTGSAVIGNPALHALSLAAIPAGTRDLPSDYALLQNSPNPFNPSTALRYEVRDLSRVTITVYDLLGRAVETLVDEVRAPGRYSVSWNASRFTSGVYYARMIAATASGGQMFSAIRKMVYVK